MAFNFLSQGARNPMQRAHELGLLPAANSYRESDLAVKHWIRYNRSTSQLGSNTNGQSSLVRQLARRQHQTFLDIEHPFELYNIGENEFGIRRGVLHIPMFITVSNVQRIIELYNAFYIPDFHNLDGTDFNFTVDWNDGNQPHGSGVSVWAEIQQNATDGAVLTIVASDYIDNPHPRQLLTEHYLGGTTNLTTTYFPIGTIDFPGIDKTDTAHWVITSWTFSQYINTNFAHYPVQGSYRGTWGEFKVYYPGDVVFSSGDSKFYIWGSSAGFFGGRLAAGVNYDPTVGGSGWLALT